MKKIYLLLLIVSVNSAAQDFAKQASFVTINYNTGDPIEVVIKKNNSYLEGRTSDIPTPVYTSFNTIYKGATNVTCFIDENMTSVTCLFNDETTIIKYKNDGTIFSIRKTYSADKLEPGLLSFLSKEINPAFQIKYITELQQEGLRSFNINLSSKKEWMTLKLASDRETGELQVVGRQVSSTNYK